MDSLPTRVTVASRWVRSSSLPIPTLTFVGHHGTGYPISWPITAAKVKETWDRVLNIETARIRKFLAQSIPSLAEAPIIFTRLCLYCDTCVLPYPCAPN